MRGMENSLAGSWLSFVLATALLVVSAWSALAEPVAGSGTSQKKAATIYNLCKFIRWPAAASAEGIGKGADFTICVVNGADIYRELTSIEGATVGGVPVRVVEMEPDLSQIAQCRVLFLARSDEPVPLDHRVDPFIDRAGGYPLLTISDAIGFTRHGGMIELIQSGDRVRFTINVKAARQAGLHIAAPLLSIATTVKP